MCAVKNDKMITFSACFFNHSKTKGGEPDMNQERKKQILELLLKEKKVSVKALANQLYISEPSIRRDLCELEKQKLLRRVHGGAILEEHSESHLKIPFLLREMEDYDAKNIIAQKAIELVRDGDVIMLDASSSAYALIPLLTQRANVTVITSGVKALLRLAECGINAYSTGGHLIASCLSLTDSDSHGMISHYNADLAIFSCRGISPDGMLTDLSIEENLVRRQMMAHAKRSVLLCAGEKFNKTYLHNLCHVSELDLILSDAPLPDWHKA